ncbi:stage V sporulation protein AE [Alkalihalobacillus alcalophilus ATCC 27647 = CGMCC 1.3604]|uniref:Stage V sporulation protein AE n=1 Tax=Alkalihalobacillus alcalophilus ATCC 27647 = CGMCC 1.3604 TaxID=1218173 RepID=A0A094YYJ0_ALKAL|nr:stage V sporulation protein AE [Alkalihalobacillus alcalophilus ATCC 27647 = CGMCC 1.3604]
MDKRDVIFITDGDDAAKKAVQLAATEVGGRCISQSSGNPSHLTGKELVQLILKTPNSPVLVMFDDSGSRYEGLGEHAMRIVYDHPQMNVLGAIAVASATHSREWAKIDVSIDRFGNLTEYGVDKAGFPDLEIGRINGDTLYILDEFNLPIVVGVGDIGKMGGFDLVQKGAPITKKAVQLILERSGFYDKTNR